MDLEKFEKSPMGRLVPISGSDQRFGEWNYFAFVPNNLPDEPIALSQGTYLQVANTRVALASLDRSSKQLTNPRLLSGPTLRREAQSTSALEGTYATLEEVFATDEKVEPTDQNLREIMNYVRTANYAFAFLGDNRPFSLDFLGDLHSKLIKGTVADNNHGGKIRDIQVMIGTHLGSRIQDARYVPPPAGTDLVIQVRELLSWMQDDKRKNLDPVVAAAMVHYQFEALHPFNDGNGRIGRLLIVLQFLFQKVISEPLISASPWFEARRADYYDSLLAVGSIGDWDQWVRFFARGIEVSAQEADQRLADLIALRCELQNRITTGKLRAQTAVQLIDFVLGNLVFTVPEVQDHLSVTYARANKLVDQFVGLGILKQFGPRRMSRKFASPDVLAIYSR